MPTPQQIASTIAAECACLRLRGAARTMSRLYDAELRSSGIRTSQLTILVGVAMFGAAGAAIQPLAGAIAVERTTLTRNLRPLEKQGLVKLVPSPTDGRSRRVVLTRAGERALEEVYPLWKKAQSSAKAALGPEHMKALGEEVDVVNARVRGPEDADADDE